MEQPRHRPAHAGQHDSVLSNLPLRGCAYEAATLSISGESTHQVGVDGPHRIGVELQDTAVIGQQAVDLVLDIGELSSVIPMFIEDYYPLMIENRPLFKDCKLEIERTEGIAECVKCGEHYNVISNDGWCPCCHTFEKKVLQGLDFMIKEIQVPSPEEEAIAG